MDIDFRVQSFSNDKDCLLEHDIKKIRIEYLKNITEKLSRNLNLPNELVIIVPDNFGDDLVAFQKEKGLNEGYTNNILGTAGAKTLTYIENDINKAVIFINKILAYHLLPTEITIGDNCQQIAINTIHHELIHVQDNFTSCNKYNELEEYRDDGALMNLLRKFSINIWKEYYACRLSSNTYDFGSEIHINDISSIIINDHMQIKKNIEKRIQNYKYLKFLNKIETVTDELISLSSTFFNYLAYIQGNLFIYGDYSVVHESIVSTDLKKLNLMLYEINISMCDEFNNLFNTYNNWSYSSFNKLSENILKYWNSFGIFPQDVNQKDVLYWNIK